MHDFSKPARSSALVVEGGAMRGIFAAGVLDLFITENIYPFTHAYGVSAGSTNCVGYLAGNHKRSYQIITDHARRDDFMSLRRYLKGGHFCDVSWLWHASLDELPLDILKYQQRGIPLTVVTTSVASGEPRYFVVEKDNMNDLFPASCAMPLVFRDFPPIENEPMTDGGLTDSIPVIKAYEDGARDITVIRSRPLSYNKDSVRFPSLLKPFFTEHPELFAAVTRRAEQYNRALAFIENPPEDCRIRVIAPPDPFPVSRFTQDLEALNAGYEQGILAAEDFLNLHMIRSDAANA
ncbi:MAG: patatin family protein [Idiomarina sp.]|nr:patatin family protein [Idiomarina sp.]